MSDKKTLSPGRWWRVLLMLALAQLVIGAIGCAVFYRYAAIYEKTRPELAMEQLMNNTSSEQWKHILSGLSAEIDAPFEDVDTLFQEFYQALVKDVPMFYRKDLSRNTEEEAVFSLYAGPVKLCRAVLRPKAGSETGFGRSQWEVDRFETVDFRQYLDGQKVYVKALEGTEIIVNGIPLGSEYIDQQPALCPNLSEVESRSLNPPHYVQYCIDALYGQISVFADGEELSPEESAEDSIRFSALKQEHGFTLQAPEGLLISLSGTTLDRDLATEAAPYLFESLESFTQGKEYHNLRYTADHLYIKPEICAYTPEGNIVAPYEGNDGTLYFFYPSDPDFPEDAKITAETFFGAYINYASHTGMATLWDVLRLTAPNSPMKKYLMDSRAAMIWAPSTSMDEGTYSLSNFHRIGNDCFFCTAFFDGKFTSRTWYETYSFEQRTGFQLVFIREGNHWRAAAMSPFE